MKISKQARRDAKVLFRCCQADGLLQPSRVMEAVRSLTAQKPRGYVQILSRFKKLVELDLARRTAKVESAIALDAALQAQVSSNLTRAYGPGLDISFAVNPGLIGGLRVQVGSDVVDGSISARLVSLQQTF